MSQKVATPSEVRTETVSVTAAAAPALRAAQSRAEVNPVDFEETQRLGILAFDEKTETWFLRARESQRLMLTRQSLTRLVQMYNSIHRGSPLVLLAQTELRTLEEARRCHAEAAAELRARAARPSAADLFRAGAESIASGLRMAGGFVRALFAPAPPPETGHGAVSASRARRRPARSRWPGEPTAAPRHRRRRR